VVLSRCTASMSIPRAGTAVVPPLFSDAGVAISVAPRFLETLRGFLGDTTISSLVENLCPFAH
jgi:hypothetical protein